MKLVWDKPTGDNNPRNSEGSFIRQPDGGILFAYSRYSGNDWNDHARCNIAAIRSFDEGETWSEPEILVDADFFGVNNIMSVSAIYQKNGDIGLYFLIKENQGGTTFARALSPDGYTFVAERCVMDAPLSYYVMNNDRLTRLQDGRLAAPVAMHAYYDASKVDPYCMSTCLLSEDDGKTFVITPCRLTIAGLSKSGRGMQEPGVYQHKDGTVRLWARTTAGHQYEAYTRDLFQTFTQPTPSVFTSPNGPLQMVEHNGILYAIYSPTPKYNGMFRAPGTMGRTPFVLQTSTDDGRTWSDPKVIEDDPTRGFCYPAVFFTKDGSMLLAYCRGGEPEEECCLQRLGMMKIPLKEIQD